MEDSTRSRLIEAIETTLEDCERQISALAREALNPKTPATQRAEILIRRAEMQSRSVSLSRQLHRLRFEPESLGCLPEAAERPNWQGCPESESCQWLLQKKLSRTG